MALTKNTVSAETDKSAAAKKAAATKAANKAKAAPAAAAAPVAAAKPVVTKGKAALKAVPAPAPTPDAEAKATLGKKQIAEGIRVFVRESGMGLPPKLAELVVEGFEHVVVNALAEGKEVRIQLGRFFAQEVAARVGRNPATGEELQVAAHIAPKFKPAPSFKKLLNGGEAEAEAEAEGETEGDE